MHVRIQLLELENFLSISNWRCLITLLTVLIRLRMTTCLLSLRIGWDHSSSVLMTNWWNVSKHGWAYKRQNSLAQAFRNVFPDTNASFPAVTALKCSISMYVFSVYNYFLLASFVNSPPEVTFRIALYNSNNNSISYFMRAKLNSQLLATESARIQQRK
jgi:hypothetical protein